MPLCKKTEAELAPRGAIKKGAIYLFSKQPFVLIRSHNTLCVFNTALTKSKIWLRSHDSYLTFGVLDYDQKGTCCMCLGFQPSKALISRPSIKS